MGLPPGPRLCTVICISTSSRLGLGVLDKDVKVTIVVKDARVDQFELGSSLRPRRRSPRAADVGKYALRILVEHFHVGMRRRGIKVVVQFLDILAMIALAIGKTKESFFQNRVACVPQAKDKQRRCWSSQKPAIPSSPQR